ncbi:MAG: flotillin domain-containing protein, partial [Pseudomonadota bacterium]
TAQATEEASRRKSVDVTLAEKAAEEMRIASEAERIRATVEAEAQKLINEAENILTDEARHSLFKRKMLEHVEGIVAASAKPLEKINDIKIMQLGGAGTQGLDWAGDGPGGNGGGGPGSSPTDEVMNSALRYRVQAPMVDSLLSDIGLDGSNIAKSDIFRNASDLTRATSEIKRLKGGDKPVEKK